MCSSVLNTKGGSSSNEANSPASPAIFAASRNDSANRSIASSIVCSRSGPPGHRPTQSQPTCLANPTRSRKPATHCLRTSGLGSNASATPSWMENTCRPNPSYMRLSACDPLRFAGRRIVAHRPAFDQFDAVESLPAGKVQDLPNRIDPVVVLARRHEAVESDRRFPAAPWATAAQPARGSTQAAAAPPIHCNMVRRFIGCLPFDATHARSTSCSTSTGQSARTRARH